MSWRVELRYNGRISGKQILTREVESEDMRDADSAVHDMTAEATRLNGAIFVTGWTVDWVNPPLIDDGEEDGDA